MYIRFTLLLLFTFFYNSFLLAQTGSVKGRVYDLNTNKPIAFASVAIEGSTYGTTTDTNGYYIIPNIDPGTYNISCKLIGYKIATAYEIQVTSIKTVIIDFKLEENATLTDEALVVASPFNKTEESPISLRTIGSSEIYRNPGGNRDISKVIQTLPGVGSSVSFRNDIIVRGGAPNENRFFIDGIEVPNINHFATQGSSGGPVGLINVNFIKEVDFYSGAFPANRGNALSSVMDFKQISGNDEKLTGTIMAGSSDLGITLDGPLNKNINFIFSVRRSYLQLLFKALALPFLPTYNDFQLKNTIKFKKDKTLTIIGLGAVDDFVLNKNVNVNLKDSATIERNEYILGYLPVNTQWNYTIGFNYKIPSTYGTTSFIVSRNHLNNKSIKYRNNDERPQNLLLKYNSGEIENKFRIEKSIYRNEWKLNFGLGYEHILYTNSTLKKTAVAEQVKIIDFNSDLSINKYALFTQVSRKLFNSRLILSLGMRTDFNDYSNEMLNLFNQISPRFSSSYAINEKLFFNFNTGTYFQLPAYTVLGYRDSLNILTNKRNNIKYIQCSHLVSGFEYNPNRFLKITIEGFYKKYTNYPFLLKDSISLANLGADFGIIGNEPANSTSKGRSYGIEFFVQQKLSSNFYGILSYTFFISEFLDKNSKYRPSSWDNRHLLNVTLGKRLPKNWELGAKFRLLGGAPYTTYNITQSSLKKIWDITGQGIFDWNRLNEERYATSHGLDIRIDKKWFFKKWSLNTYLDIQNLYNFQLEGQPFLNVRRDSSGNPITDPNNPEAYKTYLIANENGTVLPSIGIMIEF